MKFKLELSVNKMPLNEWAAIALIKAARKIAPRMPVGVGLHVPTLSFLPNSHGGYLDTCQFGGSVARMTIEGHEIIPQNN